MALNRLPVDAGIRHGSLVLTGRVEYRHFKTSRCRYVEVKCDCGSTPRMVALSQLNTGHTKTCGCGVQKARTKHNSYKTRLYSIWTSMNYRCNPNSSTADQRYKNYALRGIRVCEEWRTSFESFQSWALDNGYNDRLSIDRFPDQNGNYEPGNCRWATSRQQNRNTRRNHLLTANGETKTITDWAEDPRVTVPRHVVYDRIARGYDVDRALFTPLNDLMSKRAKNKSIKAWETLGQSA